MFSLGFTEALISGALVLIAIGTVSLLVLLYRDYKNDRIW